MLKNFRQRILTSARIDMAAFGGLKLAICILAVLNVAAAALCLRPVGGSRGELTEESGRLRKQIELTTRQSHRLHQISSRVQLGSKETAEFQTQCILPKRAAYGQVIAELQRMSKAASLQERDGVFTEEPIEGTPDLAILNNTANYQGSYENLMRFLHEADRSPMLLMLDNLQAAPEQKGGQINVSIRFQAVIRDSAAGAGAQP